MSRTALLALALGFSVLVLIAVVGPYDRSIKPMEVPAGMEIKRLGA